MTDTTPVARLLYTPVEAANALGISRSSLYVLLAQGAIRSIQIGGSRRIPVDALATFIDSLRQETTGTNDCC
jgi:excisionase family DNA binding protein